MTQQNITIYDERVFLGEKKHKILNNFCIFYKNNLFGYLKRKKLGGGNLIKKYFIAIVDSFFTNDFFKMCMFL